MFFVFLGLVLADLALLLAWLFLGYRIGADATRLEWHQLGGLVVCVLTLFVHAVTFVYFLGTGLAIKEAHRNWGIHPDSIRLTRRFKLEAYPIAMLSIGLIIATGILGGAVRSGAVPRAAHVTLAVLATLSSLLAYVVALRLILRNGYLLGLIRGEIATIRAAAAAGTLPAEGPLPLLLRPPDQVHRPPRGFLWHRALLFLGVSAWLLYAYLEWWFRADWNHWAPYATLSALLVAASVFLRVRHPLPADVEF